MSLMPTIIEGISGPGTPVKACANIFAPSACATNSRKSPAFRDKI
jgi:hypothetical protein